MNNRGISLLEALIATAIMAANIIFYINFQDTTITSRSREKVLELVSDAGRVIKQTIANKASCSLIMQNYGPSASGGATTFTDLPQGTINSSNLNSFIPSSVAAIKNDLGNGVEIESFQVVENNGEYYLEASFNLDTKDSKKLAIKSIKRRYLLDVKMDTNSGDFVECFSETSNQVRSVAQMTCSSQGGFTNPGSDVCVEENPSIQNPQEQDCGPGANYKLSFVDGQLRMTCKPCEVETKFVRWDCQKGKYVGMRGVNWVNVCYYKTGCKEDAIADFGEEFFIQGPTKAKGGDTGTKRNCRRRRRECPGERVALENSEQIAIEASLNAQRDLGKVNSLLNTLNQYANQKAIDKLKFTFVDLKIAADAVDYAADRSIKAAEIAKSKKANSAADQAAKAKKSASEQYKKAQEILNKFS